MATVSRRVSDAVRNRVRGLVHLPTLYRRGLESGIARFVMLLVLTPVLVLFALLFGRAEQVPSRVLVGDEAE